MLVRFTDGLRDSINEIISVVIQTAFFTYIITFFTGRSLFEVSFLIILPIPLYILYVPFIKRAQPKGVLELIIKTPSYIIASLISYLIVFSIITRDGATMSIALLLLSTGLLGWFLYKTWVAYSKPKEFIPYQDRQFPKSMWYSLLICIVSLGIVLEGWVGINQDGIGLGEFFGTATALLLFGAITLVSGSYFLVSFLSGKK